jgi:hypothetical protein
MAISLEALDHFANGGVEGRQVSVVDVAEFYIFPVLRPNFRSHL